MCYISLEAPELSRSLAGTPQLTAHAPGLLCDAAAARRAAGASTDLPTLPDGGAAADRNRQAHADHWCRPLDCSSRYRALIDGEPSPVERVWMARSLRPISPEEYAFRIGPLRRWARAHAGLAEARPDQP